MSLFLFWAPLLRGYVRFNFQLLRHHENAGLYCIAISYSTQHLGRKKVPAWPLVKRYSISVRTGIRKNFTYLSFRPQVLCLVTSYVTDSVKEGSQVSSFVRVLNAAMSGLGATLIIIGLLTQPVKSVIFCCSNNWRILHLVHKCRVVKKHSSENHTQNVPLHTIKMHYG